MHLSIPLTYPLKMYSAAEREILGDLKFTWFDESGNNLAFVQGFEVSDIYEVDDDKLVCQLSIK